MKHTDTWNNLVNWLKIRSEQKNTDKFFVNRFENQISIHEIEYIFKSVKNHAESTKI